MNTNIDYDQWFEENLHWLRSWLLTSKCILGPRNWHFQGFKAEGFMDLGSPRVQELAAGEEHHFLEDCRRQFDSQLLRAAVFSVKRRFWSKNLREPRHQISGFLEQVGRLPVMQDSPVIQFLGEVIIEFDQYPRSFTLKARMRISCHGIK